MSVASNLSSSSIVRNMNMSKMRVIWTVFILPNAVNTELFILRAIVKLLYLGLGTIHVAVFWGTNTFITLGFFMFSSLIKVIIHALSFCALFSSISCCCLVYITCSLYAKKVQFSRKERAVEWKTAEVSCNGCAEHSTFSGRYSCWHLKRSVFPTNDNSVNNAALPCWAAEVAADTIAGRQTTGALLDWPSKAVCPAHDWLCIVQST